MEERRVGSTLISKDGKFLLVKSIRGAAMGLWNTPGGGADGGEPFEECAIREALEETGYKVKLKRLVGTYHFDALGKRVTKKIFEAEIISGEFSIPKGEIGEARWFSLDQLPKDPDALEAQAFTYGAIKSIQDFVSGKFELVYRPDRVA